MLVILYWFGGNLVKKNQDILKKSCKDMFVLAKLLIMINNKVNDWYDFVDVQMTKINALVLWFWKKIVPRVTEYVICTTIKTFIDL